MYILFSEIMVYTHIYIIWSRVLSPPLLPLGPFTFPACPLWKWLVRRARALQRQRASRGLTRSRPKGG